MALRFARDPGAADQIEDGTPPPFVLFDPKKHVSFVIPTPGHYPLEHCFDAAEAVQAEAGLEAPDEVYLIQRGVQQCIFKLQAGGKSYVAGVSSHPSADRFVQEDHEVLGELRAKEAEAAGLDPLSAEFGRVASFPRHFASRETPAGPFAYSAEFCRGFVELNLLCRRDFDYSMGDSVERLVLLNALNQHERSVVMSEFESGRILTQVAEHQMRNAARSHRVIAPAFRAGDYMYHPEQERLMLQCFRSEKLAGPNGFWMRAAEALKGQFDLEPKVLTVVYQLLELVSTRESNLSVNNPSEIGPAFFTYSTLNLAIMLEHLKDDPEFLTPEQWQQVFELFYSLGEVYCLTIKDPTHLREIDGRLGLLSAVLRVR